MYPMEMKNIGTSAGHFLSAAVVTIATWSGIALNVHGLSTVAHAQVKTETPIFAPMDLQAALAASRQQQRLLIVELAPNAERERGVQQRWSNPGLAAWARRHAIVVMVKDMTAIRSLGEAGIQQSAGGEPIVFRDGGYARLFGVGSTTSTTKDEKGNETVTFMTRQESRLPRSKAANGTQIDLLFKLDWTLRGLQRTHADWYGAHVSAIGAAPAWPVVTLAANGGAGIEVYAPQGEGNAAIYDALAKARRWSASEKAEDLAKATGAYVWLWEQTAPHFSPARFTIIAAEMKALADRHEPAKTRFTELYAARLNGLDPANLVAVWDVMTLARVVSAHVPPLDFLDASLNDADAVGVMPRSDRLNLEMMLPRLHFNGPSGSAVMLLASVEKDAARLKGKRPTVVSEAEWPAVVKFRRWAMLLEGSRTVAALTKMGNADTTAKAKAKLLEVSAIEPAAGEPDWAATIEMTVKCSQ